MRKYIIAISLLFSTLIYGQITTPVTSISPHAEQYRVRFEKPFYQVISEGNFNVFLLYGESSSILIDAEPQIKKQIKVKQSGKSLKIKYKHPKQASRWKDVNCYVYSTHFNAIVLRQDAQLQTDTTLVVKKMIIKNYSNGDAKININAEKVVSKLYGKGNISLEGIVKKQRLINQGEGNIDVTRVENQKASVFLNANGHCAVNSNKILAMIRGGGNLYYLGNPSVWLHIRANGGAFLQQVVQ